MGVKAESDKRFLERHGDRWRVTISVPRRLHKVLGTKLKRTLNTDSLAVANRVKWGVIQELRDQIDRASGKDPVEYAQVMREAMLVRKEVETLHDDGMPEARRTVAERAEQILGVPVSMEDHEEGLFPVYDRGREALAKSYYATALGGAMPIDMFLDEYRKGLTVKARTVNDLDRAILRLREWCAAEGIRNDLNAITTKVAKKFIKDLAGFEGGLQPRTLSKYVNRLALYWESIVYTEDIEVNPWRSVVVDQVETKHGEQERAFKEKEVADLLLGPAPQRLRDVMMIGALTGARLDAIVDMKVKDTADGFFTFKPQKKEASARDVPIHPDLEEIVARRSTGRSPDDDLFPDYPAPKSNSLRERSFKTSNEFTEYRRSVGVNEVVPGKRRALTNFHSFRRWFITKCERADVKEPLIAALVGHKRSGITLGRYSEGPEVRAAKRAVQKVRLPPLDGSPIVEPRAMTPRKRD